MNFEFNPFAERVAPPMSAAMFTAFVVARLRRVAGIEIDAQRELELRLRVRGNSTLARLNESYERFRAEPDHLASIVDETIQSLLAGEASAPKGNLSFDQVSANLLPLLLSASEWEEKRAAGIRAVVRPLVEDVGIALVVDAPETITYVELDAFPRWQIDVASGYDAAFANLEERARGISYSQIGEGEATLLIDRATDGYAATRALVPSRWVDWSNRLPGELLLGIPHRDFLIGFSRQHPKLDALRAQVAADASAHSHVLTRKLLVYREGGLQIFE